MKLFRNEKGIALVSVLILSLIALSIIATLVYLVIQGTRFSGFFKRYETAREAGTGGAEITVDLINNRGKLPAISGILLTNFPKQCDCGDLYTSGDNMMINDDGSLSVPAGSYICLCAKICDATADWPETCDSSLDANANPDLSLSLAGIGGDSYGVNAKIVNTIPGITDMSGEDLGGGPVVGFSSPGGLTQPFIYRIEVNSQSTTPQIERSRLSVLYAN